MFYSADAEQDEVQPFTLAKSTQKCGQMYQHDLGTLTSPRHPKTCHLNQTTLGQRHADCPTCVMKRTS